MATDTAQTEDYDFTGESDREKEWIAKKNCFQTHVIYSNCSGNIGKA